MARPAGLILDYGNALTRAQDQTWMDGAARRLGADAAAFRAAYWQHRHAYDADLTAAEYWGRVLAASRPGAGALDAADLAWLSEAGLSKPDPRIYQLCLDRLGLAAPVTLFVDDRADNVEAAARVRLQTLQFEGPDALERLRAPGPLSGRPTPGALAVRVANLGNSLLGMEEYFRPQSLRSPPNVAIRRCWCRGVALALAFVSMRPRQEIHMNRFAMAVGLSAGLLVSAGQAEAQWRYTDDKGASKVTQYKLDVPMPYRDAAEWIGPIGIGKPALSADQIAAAQRWDAIRRIVAAEAGLLQFKNVAAAPPLPRVDAGASDRPIPTMCITGELRAMTSPGIWKVVGGCSSGPSGFSTGYGTDGYGSFGGVILR